MKLLPVWLVWTLLTGASLAGFLLAEGFAPARIAASAAVLLAAVKVHLIIGHYMEIRWAHQPLRTLLSLWIGLVTLILLAGYWSA
jgi:hypothetical protein